ncbi:ArnT family glycosyltransferase [Halonotius sp. GCM10025705]|uniref:ArnT family glycosyltransferase n=1 Tax=Halonotius sp. GCM10025705 TaxID=3252678 RepID=UPI003609A272
MVARPLRQQFRRLASTDAATRVGRLRRRIDSGTAGYLTLGVGAGIAVFLIAVFVFPYHSVNHDEGVYLMQASMLLEGQLTLAGGDLADVFRPWFFIADGGDLYPKYNPVPAAMFAVSMALFNEPRVTLAVVAAGNAVLVAILGSMVADRRVGLLAGLLFAASPMTLFTSSVFLPYAPTTLLNLSFAVAYLHGVRTGSLRAAAVAGVAIGLAAFARPYTAILFAAPFIVHALWEFGHGLWIDDRSLTQQVRLAGSRAGFRSLPNPVQRNTLTGIGGLAFVGLTLAYNAVLTGAPLTFPYQAFAPLDGPGFGFREILDHEVVYTLDLAIESNRYALQFLGTRWFVGGVIGTLAAAGGLLVAARWWRKRDREWGSTAGLLLAGLFVSVPLGNIPFWGTHNMLAELDNPANGLVSHFGPFYYFDLLVPLSIFAALGLVVGWRWLREGAAFDRLATVTSPTAAGGSPSLSPSSPPSRLAARPRARLPNRSTATWPTPRNTRPPTSRSSRLTSRTPSCLFPIHTAPGRTTPSSRYGTIPASTARWSTPATATRRGTSRCWRPIGTGRSTGLPTVGCGHRIPTNMSPRNWSRCRRRPANHYRPTRGSVSPSR